MPREDFWEVIKDDVRRTYEVVGRSMDDTPLIDLVCEMQDHGMHVRYDTIPSSRSRLGIADGYRHIRFTEEPGLHQRLLGELAEAKRKRGGPSKA